MYSKSQAQRIQLERFWTVLEMELSFQKLEFYEQADIGHS